MNTPRKDTDFLDSCLVEIARDEQAHAIISLIKSTAKHTLFQLDTRFSHPELLHPAKSASSRAGIALVARFDQRIIGFISAHKSINTFSISHIYIDPSHQLRGLGALLLTSTISHLLQSENAQPSFNVWIESHLQHAIAFFEHLGFIKTQNQRQRLKKLSHLNDDERDASSIEIELFLSDQTITAP